MMLFVIYGAFTLTERDEKWLVSDRVGVLILYRDNDGMGYCNQFIGLCLSVNTPLNLQICSRMWIMTVMLKFHVDYQSSSHDFFKESMKVASFAYFFTKKTKTRKKANSKLTTSMKAFPC